MWYGSDSPWVSTKVSSAYYRGPIHPTGPRIRAYEQSDVPLLLVFQNAPKAVEFAQEGDAGRLRISFAGEAGRIAILPPFGHDLRPTSQTEKWLTDFPADVKARCDLWANALGEVPVNVRETVAYDAAQDRVTFTEAFEYLKVREGGQRYAPLPAMLALHPTGPLGKGIVAGLGERPNRAYALELAQRGYVVLAPDYPSFGDYAYDFQADAFVSGTMKGIFNHMRAVDLLQERSDGVLAFHSCSKRSGLTGYRTGFIAGDAGLIAAYRRWRVHFGCASPAFIEHAAAAAWADDAHAAERRAAFAAKRAILAAGLAERGIAVLPSQAGLYLWARAPGDGDADAYAARCLERGIVISPGGFFGAGGAGWFRLALVPSPEPCRAALARWPG